MKTTGNVRIDKLITALAILSGDAEHPIHGRLDVAAVPALVSHRVTIRDLTESLGEYHTAELLNLVRLTLSGLKSDLSGAQTTAGERALAMTRTALDACGLAWAAL